MMALTSCGVTISGLIGLLANSIREKNPLLLLMWSATLCLSVIEPRWEPTNKYISY